MSLERHLSLATSRLAQALDCEIEAFARVAVRRFRIAKLLVQLRQRKLR